MGEKVIYSFMYRVSSEARACTKVIVGGGEKSKVKKSTNGKKKWEVGAADGVSEIVSDQPHDSKALDQLTINGLKWFHGGALFLQRHRGETRGGRFRLLPPSMSERKKKGPT
jgi:hypothetical protein